MRVRRGRTARPPKSKGEVVGLLNEAKTRFTTVIAANPDTDEASRAKPVYSADRYGAGFPASSLPRFIRDAGRD